MENLSPEVLEVLNSKTYVRTNSVEFRSPLHYFEPMLERLDKHGLIQNVSVRTSARVVNANEDGSQNVSFGRVLLEVDTPNFGSNISIGKIGLVYGLDIQKPIIKAYSGQEVTTCMNLCIFNPKFYIQQELLSGMDKVYAELYDMVDKKVEDIEIFRQYYERMNERVLTVPELDELMGRIIRLTPQYKFNSGYSLNAMKLLFDEESSMYHVKNGASTQWNVYQAITQGITEKADILDQSTKTILLNKIMFGDDKN